MWMWAAIVVGSDSDTGCDGMSISGYKMRTIEEKRKRKSVKPKVRRCLPHHVAALGVVGQEVHDPPGLLLMGRVKAKIHLHVGPQTTV